MYKTVEIENDWKWILKHETGYLCVTALIANKCFDFVLNIFGGTIELVSVMTKEMLALVNCRCNALLYVICKVPFHFHIY